METFPYMVNKDLKQRAALSEEMRVLYVALLVQRKTLSCRKIKDTDKKQDLNFMILLLWMEKFYLISSATQVVVFNTGYWLFKMLQNFQ